MDICPRTEAERAHERHLVSARGDVVVVHGEARHHARIGRVRLSKAGKSLYYRGQTFKSLKGRGFKSNYYDIATGEEYWISGPRRDGRDRLYGERVAVEIDEDVRTEYWTRVRRAPARKAEARA